MAVPKILSDMKRVWMVTRKPTKKEYFLTFKVVLIGLLIVGFVGFVIEMIWHLLLRRMF